MSGAEIGATVGPPLIAALFYGAYKLIRRKKLRGCILIRGKTYLSNSLGTAGSKTILFDIEAEIKQDKDQEQLFNDLLNNPGQFRLRWFSILKKIVTNIRDSFLKNKIILMSSNYELLKYCEVSAKKIRAFLPSARFMEKLKIELDPEKYKILVDQRTQVLAKLGNDNKRLTIYDNDDELVKLVKEKYSIDNRV